MNAHTKVCIICKEHGEFWQKPYSHLRGIGCKKCGIDSTKSKTNKGLILFVNECIKKYGNKYDYSKVEYINSKTKVCIICPIHGEFWKTPYSFLKNKGCHKCVMEKMSKNKMLTTDKWIEKAKIVHNNYYDYSKTIYNGYYEKVCIICPIHGEFWQISNDHLQGKGCPKCKRSKMEIDIENLLIKNNIKYISQYKPLFLINGKSHLSLDFYLPDYGIAIECQGEQHFVGGSFYGKNIDKIIERDILKNNLCINNNINILYYTNIKKPKEYFSTIFNDKETLLKEIIKNEKRLL